MLAIWTFIGRGQLPQETDAELRFRLAELSYLVRGGVFYPRWGPAFIMAGYPIFNYYAPLTYYVGLLLRVAARLGYGCRGEGGVVLGLLRGRFQR
ncbi:MAG: hypothetical protein IPK53_08590 [bacterium]|nr:hypothetical protein [bacterium]